MFVITVSFLRRDANFFTFPWYLWTLQIKFHFSFVLRFGFHISHEYQLSFANGLLLVKKQQQQLEIYRATDAPHRDHPHSETSILQKKKKKKKKKKLKKKHNSHNNRRILSLIELDLYFMIIYLCIKYESNTLIFSKQIKRKQ